MPSEGRLPPRRRARRVVYKLVADLLECIARDVEDIGRIDLRELARSADLWQHPKAVRFIKQRGDDDGPPDEWVDVDELKAAMREVSREMTRAIAGRSRHRGPVEGAGKSRRKGLAGKGGGR